MPDVDILDILKRDYHHFPSNQTFSIYAADVYFKDPMNQFRGCDRYRQMIDFIQHWFHQPQLELFDIQRQGQKICTEWRLSWTTPLPWQPRIQIDGWSELLLDESDRIISHIDYWHCSRWHVVQQHFPWFSPDPSQN